MYKAASRIRLRQFSFHLQTIQTIGWQLPSSQLFDCQNITTKNQTIWQFFRNSRFYWESAIWTIYTHIDQLKLIPPTGIWQATYIINKVKIFQTSRYCQLKEKYGVFLHFFIKTFGGKQKNIYLCIRFWERTLLQNSY